MIHRVLLSAFACEPQVGSDEEVGWQWALLLAQRGLDVTVLTRQSHQNAIVERVAATGECANVRFEYVDLPQLNALLRRINRRNYIYYYFWQWVAYLRARQLNAAHRFDVVHHVTWQSFRQPSFMGCLDVPFVFGPVAGADEMPPNYSRSFSWGQRALEMVRTRINALVRFDPFMRMTYRQARTVLFTSESHLARVPAWVVPKAQICLGIGVVPVSAEPAPSVFPGQRLLFVGRCIGWKGMDFGLQAFAKVLTRQPGVTLTVVGDGVDRARWMATAEKLGLAHAITWLGWVKKDALDELYQDFDMLFYPSLHDSGGFVVLEALQRGLPVVCFRLGGPGVVVNDSCGTAVIAKPDMQATAESFADAVIGTLNRLREDPMLRRACVDRANSFTWDSLVERIYGPANVARHDL